MSLVLSAALLASTAVTPVCSWDRPGHRAFMGDVVAAVDRYQDIPAPVRSRLKQRMATRQFDEMATIERDAIRGRHRYAPDLREMHFGQGQICATVKRDKWPAGAQERGLVYCESGHCLIVPTVCRNVARVTRLADRVTAEAPGREPGQSGIEVVTLPRERAGTAAEPGLPATGLIALPSPGPSFEQLSTEPPRAALPGLADPLVLPDPVAPEVVALPAKPADPEGGAGAEVPALPALPLMPDAAPALPPDVLVPPAPIPEPGAWAMLLAGLALTGLLLRRRASA